MGEYNYNVFTLRLGFHNLINYCYIIVDEATREAALIDPAWNFDAIYNVLQQAEAKLTTILLTHSHFDHVNMVKAFVRKFNSRVFMSTKEIEFYNYSCPNLNAFNDMEEISLGETSIRFLLTPGHTAGSSCYLVPGALFTGDTVFIEGCGLCSSKGGDPKQMFESIQKLKFTLQLDTKIYPGHSYGKRPGHTLKYLMEENIYFLIDQERLFIDFRMRKNQQNPFAFK